jgi:hypothetical protein
MTQHDNPELRQNLNSYFLTRKEKTAMMWHFGHRGSEAIAHYLRQIDAVTMTANIGVVAPFDIAIWAYGITRTNNPAGTVEIRENGVAVLNIVMGANLILANYVDEVIITAGNVMSAYWNSGVASMDEMTGYLYCYVRP